MISFILNLPYTTIGLLAGLLAMPKSIKLNKRPLAIILNVKKFWWTFGYQKGARAMAVGNVVLLGPNLEAKDLEHELVHIEQHQKFPLIFPILYYCELFKKGYRNNKYEVEAYAKAGNIYKEK